MNETPAPSTAAAPAAPLLPLGPLLQAVGDRTRWKILCLLAAGEPLMTKEVAQGIGLSESATAKQLAILRKAGVIQIGRGRLQQIAKQFPIDPATRVLDLGYLQLRLAVAEP